MKLISDARQLHAAMGWDPLSAVVPPHVCLDGPKTVMPVLLLSDNWQKLVARETNYGDLSALNVDVREVIFTDPYAILRTDSVRPRIKDDLATAVSAELAAGDKLVVEDDLPIAMLWDLSKVVPVTLRADPERTVRWMVRRVRHSAVLRSFAEFRERSMDAAQKLVTGHGALLRIIESSGALSDTRFSSLWPRMASQSLDAVLVSAPVNGMELVGAPVPAGGSVLQVTGADEAYVLAIEGEPLELGETVGVFESKSAALRALVGRASARIGVDEGYTTTGSARALELGGHDVVGVAKMLSQWREARDAEDVASSAVVAEITTSSIEFALDWADTCVSRGEQITELDVSDAYLRRAQTRTSEVDCGLSIRPYFVNCQASSRTVYPSQPTQYAVTDASQCVKIDAGLILECNGVTVGTSDVARTLSFDSRATETYELFVHAVRNLIAVDLKAGRLCRDIHSACCAAIDGLEAKLISLGALDQDVEWRQIYATRNVGHLMGKQESFVTEFRPEDSATLLPGAVGALEIQWPYAPYAIAAEDMWVVSEEGGILLGGAVDV